MNSRERVLATINHQQPDRVPIDFNGSPASGIHLYAYVNLRKHLGLGLNDIRVYNLFGMGAWVEQDVLERFSVDVMRVPELMPRFGIPIKEWKPWRLPDGTPVQVPVGFETVEDKDGSLLLLVGGHAVGRMPKSEPYFLDLVESDMGGLQSLAEPPDPETVSFPLLTDEDLRFRQEWAKHLYDTTDKALVVELMEPVRWNTSITNWLYALAANPDRTFELQEKKSLNLVEKAKQLAQAVGPYVSIFAIGSDYGTQRGELISPDVFRWSIAPVYRRVFDWIHQNTKWKVWFHSCGSIYRLIPHMIDMGVDILNPLQCNTPNMEPERLKREFGDRLVFWGGGVDTQTVLPFGTPDEVRQQARERISILAPGGGYVFAPTQDIQADVSPENLIAMYDTARDFGRYPLGAS